MHLHSSLSDIVLRLEKVSFALLHMTRLVSTAKFFWLKHENKIKDGGKNYYLLETSDLDNLKDDHLNVQIRLLEHRIEFDEGDMTKSHFSCTCVPITIRTP